MTTEVNVRQPPETPEGLAEDLLVYFTANQHKGVELAGDRTPEGFERHMTQAMAMINTYTAYRLLTALRKVAPNVAGGVCAEIWECVDDGAVFGEYMWQWAHEKGLTPCRSCRYPGAWPNAKCSDHRPDSS